MTRLTEFILGVLIAVAVVYGGLWILLTLIDGLSGV